MNTTLDDISQDGFETLSLGLCGGIPAATDEALSSIVGYMAEYLVNACVIDKPLIETVRRLTRVDRAQLAKDLRIAQDRHLGPFSSS
ncbi:hypothetical protein [uncultured Thiodictyon sp.]|jgi:hypothetical protein|uniref:hypothetical protein n=1 Tax=uncultured Thiodictyon sp. TaxID=1846217 RepID=UPI0025FE4A59|nr:hypothetical protein [uncultured Thiodictyon sp.]